MQKTYKAYFSYAHVDEEVDPRFIGSLIKDLERRVTARLPNEQFRIWRDKQGLRTGDKWDSRLEKELRASDILIVLLTPRWIGSASCRKEYSLFQEVEGSRGVEDQIAGYVVPILLRDIERQKGNFTSEQLEVYSHIASRQYQPATDLAKMAKGARGRLLEKLADDIEGIIERRRSPPERNHAVANASSARPPAIT